MITREDIGSAYIEMRDCESEERKLIKKFGLDGKPKEVQEGLCPELKTVRERCEKASKLFWENY